MSIESGKIDNQNSFLRRNIVRLIFNLFIAMSLGMILLQPLRKTVAFVMIDDAMYYPRVAQNVVQLGKFTYDGITITNGFHPLWEIILIPLYFLVSDPMLALKLVYWMIFAILLAGLWFFTRSAKTYNFSVAGIVAAFFVVFVNIRSFTIIYCMLESHLLLSIYLVYIYYASKCADKRFTDVKFAFLNGILLGLAFLARVDSFLLALCYGAVLVFRVMTGKQGVQSFLKASASSATGCLLMVVPYLLSNYISFGHVSTVSAWSKQVTISVGSLIYPLKTFYQQFIPRVTYILGLPSSSQPYVLGLLVIIGLAFLALMFTGKRRDKVSALYRCIPEFITFACVHVVFVYIFAPGEFSYSAWYYISEIIAGGLIAGAVVSAYNSKRIDYAAVVLLVLLILAQAMIYPGFVRRKTMTWAKLEMADYMNKNMPEHSRSAMHDSGIVSYFSQRNIMSLNGLIGDFEMAQLAKTRSYEEIFRKYELTHIIIDVPENMLNKLPGEKVFIGEVKTKVTNFKEGAKPFTLIKVSPGEIEKVMKIRYGR